jgi:hypothetical protein
MLQKRLQALAAAEAQLPPPYGFDEFLRRAGGAIEPQRTVPWLRVAAGVAVLAVALVGWRLLQPADAPWSGVASGQAGLAAEAAGEPARVKAGTAVARADLEDQIALIDALLSEARVSGGADENIRAMQESRSLLVDGLQRVAWAEALIED